MHPADPVVLKLPAVMDLRAAAPLARELDALRGCPLTLDAGAVERLGGLCLQILLSARLTWHADGADLGIVNATPDFLQSLADFGALPTNA